MAKTMSSKGLIPLAVVLVAALLTAADVLAAPREPSGYDEGFVPSTEGKKLLHFRGPVAGEDDVAFDGVMVGGPIVFLYKANEEEQMAWAAKQAAQDFGRHTDNFYICYSCPGRSADDFDWFDTDFDWIVENWRLVAKAAKAARFKGICFDTEFYEGLPLFGYEAMRHADTKTFEEYQAQVRMRAAEIMRAVNSEFPDLTILVLFGFSGSFNGVPQHPVTREKAYTLVSSFVDGLLSECGPDARIYDMHEQSFSFRIPGSFARTRAMMKDLLVEESAYPDRYRANHRAGFSFWVDCWCNTGAGRPFYASDFQRNYYTPEEFAYSLHHALAYSDGYVWMWGLDWWKRTVEVLDEEGNKVRVPLPREYYEALRVAHEPYVPEPPPRLLPNTFRNEPASTQQGWSDEETFADLWDSYEFVEDLPAAWRFHIDPDEVGEGGGWAAPGFDDSLWPTLQIREFWENQGYSPYDGQAWYRLAWTPPELPDGKRVFIAFGGVADEASVFVDGRLLYASTYGENIRHDRFLVDVTDRIRPGVETCIAVRVWNTGWCGGIWKNVKLVVAD